MYPRRTGMSFERYWNGSAAGEFAHTYLAPTPLPPVALLRWTIRVKAEVVTAVERGVLSAEAACARRGLTPEELASWHAALAVYGRKGVRATRRVRAFKG
jgi:hypothetical protein